LTYHGHTRSTSHLDIWGLCLETIKNIIIARDMHPKRILDLGAHHGQGLRLLGTASGCERYVMVEPMPQNVDVILGILEHRGARPSAELFPGVIGRTPGTTTLFSLPGFDQSSNLFNTRGGAYGDAVPVEVPIIDFPGIINMLGGDIDFMKCNIEGAEFALMDDGFFDNISDGFVLEAHNMHCPAAGGGYRNVQELIDGLKDDFDIVSHGTLEHKYCFLSGIRMR